MAKISLLNFLIMKNGFVLASFCVVERDDYKTCLLGIFFHLVSSYEDCDFFIKKFRNIAVCASVFLIPYLSLTLGSRIRFLLQF
jgi:hypothetical protein